MSKKTSCPWQIPALKVRQWLTEWNDIHWKPNERRAKPQHWFYQFSISAADLKALSGIYARTTKRKRGSQDLGIQRRHEEQRSNEISRFVRYGYPWSDLPESKRSSGEFGELRQPGWLPTAIVVNILLPKDQRLRQSVARDDLITVKDGSGNGAVIELPESYSGPKWRYQTISPIEVIDGQHRLWACEGADLSGDFELPVVAFVGLDLSWQAYLFYTINIKPKKINASLAFDLYPLLRTEEWLNKFEGHVIYRETRAQELVDLLWSTPESPWYHRINMLGEKGFKGLLVTQAAWVRALLAAFVKSWEGRGVRIGGLFGTAVGQDNTVLPWTKAEQAAFLIVAGQYLRDAISDVDERWAQALREQEGPHLFKDQEEKVDLAFFGPNTLLNQDQGIRTLLHIVNDMCFVRADDLGLREWPGYEDTCGSDEEQLSASITSFKKKSKITKFLKQLANGLATYDWRASSGPDLTEGQRILKAGFRGSGGYKALRGDVLKHLTVLKGEVATAAGEVKGILGY